MKNKFFWINLFIFVCVIAFEFIYNVMKTGERDFEKLISILGITSFFLMFSGAINFKEGKDKGDKND